MYYYSEDSDSQSDLNQSGKSFTFMGINCHAVILFHAAVHVWYNHCSFCQLMFGTPPPPIVKIIFLRHCFIHCKMLIEDINDYSRQEKFNNTIW